MKKPSVFDCSVIELSTIKFRSGNITPVTSNESIPFKIKRVFYLYDIPGGEERGGHAHINCHQFLVAASGSFEIEINDGINKRTVSLNRSYFGLYIPPGVWAAEKGFSSGAICLVLASDKYDDKDYIRNFDVFKEYRKK